MIVGEGVGSVMVIGKFIYVVELGVGLEVKWYGGIWIIGGLRMVFLRW